MALTQNDRGELLNEEGKVIGMADGSPVPQETPKAEVKAEAKTETKAAPVVESPKSTSVTKSK